MLDGINGTLLIDTASQQLVTTLIDVWVKPKIEKLKNKFDKTHEEVDNFFNNPFKDYLDSMYKKSGIMNTIIFHKVPKKIESLYIPLTLEHPASEINDFTVEYHVKEFINEFNNILITDSAGMGKSTLVKWMFRKCLEHNMGIPILIELRKLREDNTIVDEIINELNGIRGNLDKEFVYDLIAEGDFIFFLDGYDEISLNARQRVTEDLQDFISKASNNKFILSSRNDPAIASFGEFYNFSIRSLETEQAYDLLRKYAKVDETEEITEELIIKIQQDTNFSNLSAFLSNPLMVTLLYKGYDYKQTIPYKKSIFYRQVYDALYEGHDLTKGGAYVRDKLSGLDIESFHTVLRTLGFITFKQNDIEYSRDNLVKLLKQSRELSQIEFDSSLFLKDLELHVPLFYREGDSYRWTHKSLQEYFAASFICIDAKDKQDSILNSIYENEKNRIYLNVLDLCYDMDYRSFKKTIINNFTIDILNYFDNELPYETDKIKLSKQYFFGKSYIVLVIAKDNNNDFHENIKKSIPKLIEKGQEMQMEFIGASSSNVELIVCKFSNHLFEITQFLFEKGEKFILNKEDIHDRESILTLEDNLIKELQHNDVDEFYLVDNSKQPWNSNFELYFDAIDLLKTLDSRNMYYFDFKELEKVLNSIEKMNSTSDDLFKF